MINNESIAFPASVRERLTLEEEVARLKLLHDKLKFQRDIIKISAELDNMRNK